LKKESSFYAKMANTLSLLPIFLQLCLRQDAILIPYSMEYRKQ